MNLKRFWSGICIETGCDEVGRGCLAGPVVAAAVIINEKFDHNLINDSKKLTAKVRLELDQYIREILWILRLQKFRRLSLTNITY